MSLPGPSHSKRNKVPVERAIALYNELGTWEKVRRVLARTDGSLYSLDGLWKAVRRYDRAEQPA